MPLTSEICEYDVTSPARFQAEKKMIEQRLGDLVEEIHHIGSTSIVGIKAKPEIDLLIIVKSTNQIDTIESVMSTLGYDARGECGIPGRYYFSKNVKGKRTHKAHLCTRSHRLAQELIVFRDYLRDHPKEAKIYESLKIGLAKNGSAVTREYLDGKEGYIRGIIEKSITQGYGF
jgi:GrpB-like predicted nucleotidyltransferase (UPF0157 family)